MFDARLWGKSEGLAEPYPLMGHLTDTAMVAGAVWDSVLTESQHDRLAGALGVPVAEARRLVMFWAGLHDLGKILPRFQDMALRDRPDHCAFLREDVYAHDRDSLTARFRHEYTTNAVLPQLLAQLGYPVSGPLAKVLAVQVAQLLGGHHGRYPMCAEARDVRDPLLKRPELGSGGWTGQRREHLTALHELLGQPEAPAARAMPVELAVVVAGLVIVSDWLASQDHVVSAQQTAALADGGLSTRQSLANHAKRASDAAPGLVAGAGLGRASFHPRGLTGLFPEIKAPHPLQSSLEARLPEAVAGPGVLLVTAPTGEGKTEAALYAATVMGAACGSGGLAFALPTQATANQMYHRVVAFATRNLLDPAQVTLLHGSADLYEGYADPSPKDDAEPRVLSDHGPGHDSRKRDTVSVVAGRWLRSRGRGILAPIAVGTVDQALMGVLPLKWNALRHLGLSGKTVVIDEAHAYDAFTHALLLRLLTWLGAMGTPVVLLSATLTGETAKGLVEAYLTGAGHKAGSYEMPQPWYPGWLYADAARAAVTTPGGPVGSVRSRALSVGLLPVTHTHDPGTADGRLGVLLKELREWRRRAAARR